VLVAAAVEAEAGPDRLLDQVELQVVGGLAGLGPPLEPPLDHLGVLVGERDLPGAHTMLASVHADGALPPLGFRSRRQARILAIDGASFLG
jgi:hypothetical protein